MNRRARDTWESRIDGSTRRLLDLFDAAGARATFFVLGWVAERHRALVRDIAAQGHEVATHGYGHTLLTRLTPASFREELSRAIGILEDITGQSVLGHRAPSYSLIEDVPWAFDVLLDLGIQYDSSVRRGPGTLSSPYWIPTPAGRRIREFPMTFVRVLGRRVPLATGGYFRLYPYRLTRSLLDRFTSRGVAANVCLHPWDLDAGQPRLAGIRAFPRFRHYVNLRTTEAKLTRLLSDFRFCDMRNLLGLIGAPPPRHSDRPRWALAPDVAPTRN